MNAMIPAINARDARGEIRFVLEEVQVAPGFGGGVVDRTFTSETVYRTGKLSALVEVDVNSQDGLFTGSRRSKIDRFDIPRLIETKGDGEKLSGIHVRRVEISTKFLRSPLGVPRPQMAGGETPAIMAQWWRVKCY